MTKRRAGRVAALQALFGLDIRGVLEEGPPAEEVDGALARQLAALEEAIADDATAGDGEAAAGEARAFAAELCHGVVRHRAKIDELLGRSSDNWRVERMSYVDRNVLRLATFELAECPDVPTGVAINEAIDLGKAFGTTESSGFINGVLDRVARSLDR